MSKRVATYQLTAENFDQQDEEGHTKDESGEGFNKAAQDVMAKRVIRKAKRRLDGTETTSSNPFTAFSGFTSSAPSKGTANSASESKGFLATPTFSGSSFKPPTFGSTSPGQGFSSMPKTSGVSPLAKNNTVSDSFWNSKEKNNASQNANDNEVSVVKGVKDREVESEQDKATINDTCYAEQLTALNISFLNWIKLHIEKNPLVDLTPVFNDYTKHMKDVEGKYGKPTKSDVHAKPAAKDANVIHLTNSEKQAAPGLGTVPNFGSVKQEPGAAFKVAGSSFFSSAHTSTPVAHSSNAPSVIAKGKEESAKEDDNEDENGDSEKDERTTIVEEDAIHTTRCKLFFKKGSDWKELGVGMLYLKLLGNKAQLLVRMETAAGKVLLNISLHENMPAGRVGKNNVSLISVPNPPVFLKEADGDNTQPLNYLIRVKDSVAADELLKQINENKVNHQAE